MQVAFDQHISRNLSFLKNKKLLIAISGGIDSVVLATLCATSKLDFALAHCNFNLRQAESDADEDFVLGLAETLNVEIFIESFDTQNYAKEQRMSIQMAARELRYQWFQELASQLNFDYILTAHHADDNLETFLINFTRGTGLNGLTGIPVINDNVVRPLLPFSREEIEQYAKEKGLKWREDSSNRSSKYLRNKLRHEVISVLKEINPQLLQSFQTTLDHLNDTADIVEESLNAVAKRAITSIDENGVSYKISEFKKVNNPRAYLFEMFKEFGFSEWQDVLDLLDAQSGKQVLSSTHRLIKHREHLILTEVKTKHNQKIIINKEDKSVKSPLGEFKFEATCEWSKLTKNEIVIDANTVTFPLQLRPWHEGDYFFPLGMKGKKKISKYLKDEKLSLVEKENIWLLCTNEDVIWVVGKRADDRFKVTEKTSKTLKIKLL